MYELVRIGWMCIESCKTLIHYPNKKSSIRLLCNYEISIINSRDGVKRCERTCDSVVRARVFLRRIVPQSIIMHHSNYKHRRMYAALLCLLTMNPVALGKGKQESPTAEVMGSVHEAQPQTGHKPYPGTIGKPVLTAAQQQWLDTVLRANDSNKKRFRKLLANIAHKEAYIRGEACQTAYQLFTESPKLARKNSVTFLGKIPHRVSKSEETNEALQLLCLLVAENPQLAPPASRVVLDLAGDGKGMLKDRGIGLNMRFPLTQTVINASPKCLRYLLHNLCKLVGSKGADNVTVQTLLVVNGLFNTNTAKENSVYLQQILEIVLDAARSKDEVIENMARTILGEIVQQHPSLARERIDALLEFAQGEEQNMSAMRTLLTFSAVDPSVREQTFALLINILRTTNVRVRKQAIQNYAVRESDGLLMDAMNDMYQAILHG